MNRQQSEKEAKNLLIVHATKDRRLRVLNYLRPLVSEKEEVNGRFILYSTQNTYNFILLDQMDGRTWQVQWSQDAENRGVIPIG